MNRLADKVALITGGGSGIGKAIALAYAGEGAHVCVAGRTLSKLQETASQIEKMGRKALAVRADITRLPEIDHLISEVIGYFGRIDILVNNAGVVVDAAALDVTEEQWDFLMNTDLKGVFFTTQYALPHMLKQGKGKVINIASPLAVEGIRNCSIYCAAKAAIVNLTRALAIELADRNILVNALAPGFTESPMTRHTTSDPDWARVIVKRIPLGRYGQPEDVNGAAIYLASDESNFTTGTTIYVDGGETAQ
jgi:NAD(P)-dependent dehydrogenase (short-subunit alcohol dehydrogenase family)